jgi:uncharacterized membrane protein
MPRHQHPSAKPARKLPFVGEKASIEALTHGIFAITMTLLILELRVPETRSEGHLWDQLQELGPQVAGYLFGFVYLMAVWLSIRDLYRQLRGITSSVTILSLIVVGIVSLTPFTVSTMATAIGNEDDLGTAVRLMATVLGTGYLVSGIAFKVALGQGLVAETSRFNLSWPRIVVMTTGPAVLALAVSYLNPWLGVLVLSSDIVLGVVMQSGDPGADVDEVSASTATSP